MLSTFAVCVRFLLRGRRCNMQASALGRHRRLCGSLKLTPNHLQRTWWGFISHVKLSTRTLWVGSSGSILWTCTGRAGITAPTACLARAGARRPLPRRPCPRPGRPPSLFHCTAVLYSRLEEHDPPPTSNQRNDENQRKSSNPT